MWQIGWLQAMRAAPPAISGVMSESMLRRMLSVVAVCRRARRLCIGTMP